MSSLCYRTDYYIDDDVVLTTGFMWIFRWRGGRPFDQNRQSSSHRGPRDRTMGGSQGGGPRGGSSGAGNNHNNNNININVNNNSNNTAWGGPREQVPSPVGPPQEQHVPVRGFNAAESKTALRRDPGGE